MKVAILYSDELKRYDFGPGHPFRGDRFLNFMKLFKEKGLDENPTFKIIKPEYASERDLMLIHTEEYIQRVKRYESRDIDTPLIPGIDKAARLIVGASMMAGEVVMDGKYDSAVGIGGGMHHASRSREAGFCIFNDVAICAENLIGKYGLKRVLILDTDAHAGDGTAEIFYEDPRVLLVDIHQDPRTLYPGVGFIEEIGRGEGEGFTVNIPLPPWSSDYAYELVLDELFIPLVEEFKPEIIIRNGGSDPHFKDELTQLGLTLEGFRMIGRKVRAVADRVCGGKVVDLICSGYNPTVLPYAWLALICGVSGVDVELEEPFPFPTWLSRDYGLKEVEKVIQEVKATLRDYWGCFS